MRGDVTYYGLARAIKDVASACQIDSVIRYARSLRNDPRAVAKQLAQYVPKEA